MYNGKYLITVWAHSGTSGFSIWQIVYEPDKITLNPISSSIPSIYKPASYRIFKSKKQTVEMLLNQWWMVLTFSNIVAARLANRISADNYALVIQFMKEHNIK